MNSSTNYIVLFVICITSSLLIVLLPSDRVAAVSTIQACSVDTSV